MDWRALKELKLAEQAERDFGGGGDFGEAPAPTPQWSKPISFSESESPYSAPQTQLQSTPSAPDPMAGFDQGMLQGAKNIGTGAAKAGAYGLGTLGDTVDTIGALPLTGGYVAGRTLGHLTGQEMPGSYGEDLYKGGSDLMALPWRIGQTLEGGSTERDGLLKQTLGHALESGKGAFEPGATAGESARMLGGALAGGAAAIFSQPGNLGRLPLIGNPVYDLAKAAAPGLERGGASFLKSVMREKPSDVPMRQWLARRGVINMPGKPQLTDKQTQRLQNIADDISKGNEDKAQDAWIGAMLDNRQIDTLTDLELRSIMGDQALKEARKNSRNFVGLEKAEMVANPMSQPMKASHVEPESLMKEDTARELLAGMPLEAPVEAVKPVRASTYAPRGEAAAEAGSRLERVQKAIQSNGDIDQIMKDAELLPRDDVFDLAMELGVNAQRNKGKGLQGIREALEKKALEPSQPPTTAAGRQEAKELEMAEQAEKISEGSVPRPESLARMPQADFDSYITSLQGMDKPSLMKEAERLEFASGAKMSRTALAETLADRARQERDVVRRAYSGGKELPDWMNGKPIAAGGQTAMEPSTLGAGHGEVSGIGQQGRPAGQQGRLVPEAGAEGSGLRPEAGPGGQGQPAGQPNAQPAVGGQPEPGRGVSEQVAPLFYKVEDLRLEGRNAEASQALKDAGLSEMDYSAWRKTRQRDPRTGEPTPNLQTPTPQPPTQPSAAKIEGRTPAPTSPSPPPGSPPPRGPTPPTSESRSLGQPPERNARSFVANHIDSLEKASLRANNPEGRALAERLRETIVYGESNAAKPMKRLNDSAEKVLRSPAAREEVADLFTPSAWKHLGAGDLRVGRFQAAVDDSAELMMIRPEERMLQSAEGQKYAADYIDEISALGHEAERLGVTTSKGNPFVAKERRFIQQVDPSASGWMKDGDPLFEKLKTQLSAVYPDADIKAMGEALKAQANVPLDRPAAFEFERAIPMTPAAIVDDAGELKPILRYVPIPTAVSPSNPASRIVESQWMRLGGIKAIGQDVTKAAAEGVGDLLEGTSLGASLQAGGEPVASAARGAIGALYRRPEAGYTGTNPATWDVNRSTSRFAQSFRSIFNRITPALNLGLQGVKSIPQTLGEVPAMTGAFNYARAVAKTVTKFGKASEEAEAAGAVHKKMLMAGSEVFDRHRLIESVVGANVNRTVTERFNDFVKDLNDTISYTAGTFKADSMFAKGAKKSDLFMMDEMNLPQTVQEVFRNPSSFDDAAKASARQTFGRAVSKETQFHAKNPALKGRFENDAALRWVMPYMSYSINTAKNTVKDFERVIRMSQEGEKSSSWMKWLNPFSSNKEPMRDATRRLVSRFVGMELAGEVVADISSTMQGKDPLRKDRSYTARFLENLSYVGFLGPLHFAFDMAASNLLEGDEKKKFAEARAGSRAPTLGNPTIETGLKAIKNLATGDIGGAAWDLTAGQSPAISGAARASGLIEPAGAKQGGERLYNRRGTAAEDRLFNRRGTSDNDRLFNRRGSADKDRLFQRPKRK